MQTLFLSALVGGFCWDRPTVWGVKLDSRPSLERTLHTRLASFVPRRLLNMVTTGAAATQSGTTFQELACKPSRGTNLMSPDPCYRSWSLVPRTGQSKSLVGYTLNCALHRERTMWQPGLDGNVIIPQLILVESRDATPESMHILLPPHELGSTEIYANSIVNPPLGTSSMSSESTLLSRGGTRHLDMVRMPSEKAS